MMLQKFGFRESRYERPQDEWICGRLAEGKPCELGPDLHGCCRVTTVCQPRLEADRWQCRRSPYAGGPCEAGPLPDGQCCIPLERCVPRRSLRATRKRVTLAAIALMVGLIAFFLGGEGGRHFMMPGKLSSHHAGLTDCSTCHSGAQPGRVDLLHRLFTAVEPRQNSSLCVTCHIMGAEPFTPHTHAVEDLKQRAEKLRIASKNWPPESLFQRITFPGSAKSRGADVEIQCATCHKEHQGVFSNLKAVSNQRCQTCHVSRFDAFADSHPPFVQFPYRRRPRIIFDHQSHMTKHFPEAQKAAVPGQVAPDSCADCHQLGVRQRLMVVKPFAIMCSGCHNGDLTGATQVSGPKGIDLLAVPGLDVATLNSRGLDIGAWPAKSEAGLTPFMRLLLEANGENVASGVTGLDLLDLRKASDEDLAKVVTLAWAVKRLFNWLETSNPPTSKLLADPRSGKPIDHLQTALLTGGISHDVIAAGNREWFMEHLQDDLQRHDRGERTSGFKPATAPAADLQKPPPSGPDSRSAASATKPANTDVLAPGGGAKTDKTDILSFDKSDILAPGKSDDILAPNKDNEILSNNKKDDILAPKNQDDILGSGESGAGADTLSKVVDENASKKSSSPEEPSAGKSTVATPAPFDPEAWAQAGGWYRQDFTIRYRPTGHADQFLQTWLDFAGRAYGVGSRSGLAPVFATLSSKDAIGRCTKCHSVDDQAGAKIVNWDAFDPNAIKNRFTNYSHKPHIELGGAKTCVKCHELRTTEDDFLKTYGAGDPLGYTPNFKFLDKAVCASCHSQQTAWQNCTLCHGYHVPDAASVAPGPVLPAVLGGLAVPSWLEPDASARREGAELNTLPQVTSGPAPAAARAAEPPTVTADEPSAKPAAVNSNNTSARPDASETSSNNLTLVTPEKPAAASADKQAAAPPQESAALDTNPTSLDGFLRRGHERAIRGDFGLARQDFDEVLRRDPNNAAALNDRCWVSALLDEVRDALKDCDASLQAAPNYPEALDSRGMVNLKLGYYRRAIADYNAALTQFRGPKRAGALFGRGIAKRRIGNAAGAKSDIDAAKVYNPAIASEFSGYGIQ